MSIVRMPSWAVLLACLVGCAGGTPRPGTSPSAPEAGAEPGSSAKTRVEAARDAPLDPERALGSADAIYRDQLAVGARDDRFATDRQVVELRKAIALYQQFIERAAGDPRYLEAVRRSQGRIDDAEQTIEFLLGDAAGAK